jgi:hypothetical protein
MQLWARSAPLVRLSDFLVEGKCRILHASPCNPLSPTRLKDTFENTFENLFEFMYMYL